MYVLGCHGLYKNPFLAGDHQDVETDWEIDLFRKWWKYRTGWHHSLNGGRSPINSRQIPLFSPINQFWSRIPPHFPMVVIKQSHCGNPTTIGSMQPNNPPNNVVGELDPNKTLQVEPAHHQNQSGCGKTVFFGVSSSYVPDWDTRAAFRELYQNWSVLCRHC
jgi:hypothetical protein